MKLKVYSGKKVVKENLALEEENTEDFADYLKRSKVAERNYYLLSFPISEIRNNDDNLESFLRTDLSYMPPLRDGAPPILLGEVTFSMCPTMYSAVVNGYSRIAGAINSHHTHINAYVPVSGTVFTDNLKQRIADGEILPVKEIPKHKHKATKKKSKGKHH